MKESKTTLLEKWGKVLKDLKTRSNDYKESELISIINARGINIRIYKKMYIQAGILVKESGKLVISRNFVFDQEQRSEMISQFMELRLEYSRRRNSKKKEEEPAAPAPEPSDDEVRFLGSNVDVNAVSDERVLDIAENIASDISKMNKEQLDIIISALKEAGYVFVPNTVVRTASEGLKNASQAIFDLAKLMLY